MKNRHRFTSKSSAIMPMSQLAGAASKPPIFALRNAFSTLSRPVSPLGTAFRAENQDFASGYKWLPMRIPSATAFLPSETDFFGLERLKSPSENRFCPRKLGNRAIFRVRKNRSRVQRIHSRALKIRF